MAFVSGGAGGRGLGNIYMDDKRDLYHDDFDGKCGCLEMKRNKPTKRSSVVLLKERIRQFSIWYFENEEQRETEHVKRRFERKKKREAFANLTSMKFIRWMLILDFLSWAAGLLFLLCSTIEAIGEYTPFYQKFEFKLCGIILIFFSVALLCLCVALKHKVKKKNNMNKPLRPFYIVQKKHTLKEKQDSIDSGNVEDIEMVDIPSGEIVLRSENEHEIKEHISSNTSQFLKQDMMYTAGTDWSITRYMESDEDKAIIGDQKLSLEGREKRRAWAKSKWMRIGKTTTEDAGVADSGEFQVDITDDLYEDTIYGRYFDKPERDISAPQGNKFADTHDDENFGDFADMRQSSTDTDIQCQFSRSNNYSTKSKVSEMSNFSNFSETAPLVKK